MATIEEKITALYSAHILTLRANDALTRVLVRNEDVKEVIAAMTKRTAPPAVAAPAAGAEGQAVAPSRPRPPRVQHTGEPSKTTLFVANLPFAVDDAGLQQVFEGQKVKEARVAIRRDGRSRGYGFVTFENEEDMQAALKVVDKTLVEGREIAVRVVMGDMSERKAPSAPVAGGSTPFTRRPRSIAPVGEPSKTVAFVGNLPFTVDDAGLQKLFTGYGLKDAHVSMRPNGRSKGYALVSFENEADQARAIATLNGTTLEGRQIHVLASTKGSRPPMGSAPSAGPAQGGIAPVARLHTQRVPRREPSGEPSKTTLFVANLPFVVDDSGLLQIFEGFQVKEAHVAVRAGGKSCGYGFVSLENENEAQRALQVVDKSLVEGREITVRPAHSSQIQAKPAAPAAAAPPAAAPTAAPTSK